MLLTLTEAATPAPVPVLVATPPAPNPAAQDSAALNTALNAVAQQLQDLARDPQGFVVLLEQLYGAALNRQTGDDFRRALLAGDFHWAPDVRLVSSTELGGSVLRADAGSGTVWLNREVLHNDPTQAQQALLGSLPDVLRGRLTVSGSISTSAPSPAPAVQQTSSALSDAATHDTALLDDSLKAVAQWLTRFAGDAAGFMQRLDQFYGSSLNAEAAEARRQSVLAGDFSWTPTVRLAGSQELGGSTVRYDANNRTVLLSVDLLRRSPQQAQQALLDSLPDILRGQLTTPTSGSSNTQGQQSTQTSVQSTAQATTTLASLITTGTAVSDVSGQGTKRTMGPLPSANQVTGLPPTVLLLDPTHATIALAHGSVIAPLWLEQRAVVLDAIGTFIKQSLQHALTQGPGGLGWRTFEPHWTDGPNGPDRDPIGPQGQILRWVPAAPGNPPPQSPASHEDGSLSAPQGQWWGFCHDTFKQELQALVVALPSPALEQLGVLYGVAAETLFQQHPELWDLAQQTDRSLRAGPPPVAGVAMGDATQLGMLDLHLRDPLNQQLIQTFGGTVAEPTSSLALEQIRLYGRERWEQLTLLDQALATVRDAFNNDMAKARTSNGPGWVDVPMQTGSSPETGQPIGIYQHDADGIALRDSQGLPLLATTRVFSPEVFAKQWLTQGGFVQEAFRTLFGDVRTQIVRTEQMAGEGSSETVWVAQNTLSRSPYQLTEHGLGHVALTQVDLNAPPALKDSRLVFFDFEAGWVTPHDNIPRSRSGLEQVMDVAAPIVISSIMIAVASPLIGWAGGAGSVGGAFIMGAAGAIGSSLGTTGTVRLKDVLRGGVASVLSLGLNNVVSAQFNIDLRALGRSAQIGDRLLGTFADATIRGAVQTLMGGEFEEGFKAGLASGLAKEVLRGLHLAIDQNPQLSPSEADTLRFVARIASSAVAALANPDDPLHAFAADFVGGLMSVVTEQALAEHMQTPPASTGFPLDEPILDAAGRPITGAVDTTLPPALQAEQLAALLQARGVPPDEAARQSMRAIGLQTGPSEVSSSEGTPNTHGEVVTVTGTRLPRDELGNLYEQDASGRTVVYLAGGVMVALSPNTVVSVNGGMVVGGRAILLQLAEATRAVATVARAGTPHALLLSLLAPNNETSPIRETERTQANEYVLFERQPSEVYGRVYDRDESVGQWVLRTQQVTLPDGRQVDQPVLYSRVLTPYGFAIFTDDELARYLQPITTPIASPPTPIPPQLGTGQQSLIIPGSAPDVRSPIENSPPGTAADPTHWSDLLIDRDKDEQAKFRGNVVAEHMARNPDFPRSQLANYDAHHIVPLNEYPDLQGLRDKFAVWGIDLMDPINGVLLPRQEGIGTGTPHKHTQSNPAYVDEIRTRFLGVSTGDQARAVLRQIKQDLLAETFFPK